MKNVAIIVVLLGGLAVAWYLISPAFIEEELDEASPLAAIERVEDTQAVDIAPAVNDAFDIMNEQQRAAFEKAVEEMRDEVIEMDEPMEPIGPQLVAQGTFKPHKHEVAGEALLIENGNERIIRFENFETINGPNLHIYLSSDLGDDDYIDLGEIRATKGNVNYTVSPDVDLKKYNKILVWCVPFKVLFSYAELVNQ